MMRRAMPAWIGVCLVACMAGSLAAGGTTATLDGVIRKAGPRWPFQNGDRVYWFGGSSTSIGLYCSVVEFYLRTRFPDNSVVSAHKSKPTGLDARIVASVIDERKPTIVFPVGGFYDSPDPAEFSRCAAAVFKACTNKNVKCIFVPTMWLAGASTKLHPAFRVPGAKLDEVAAQVNKEANHPNMMMVPVEIHGPYFRCKKGLALDRTMAALQAWGAASGALVLETYADQADWAKAQWAKDPDFAFLEGSTPHLQKPGYLALGFYALNRLDAPIVESRLELDAAPAAPVVLASVNCVASELSRAEGGIQFRRLDKALPVIPPMPPRDIPGSPAPVLELSPYLLRVGGLPAGGYDVIVEGVVLGRATAEEMAKGVNLNAIYLSGGAGRDLPWSALWDACRGNTMDEAYTPTPDRVVGRSAWLWEVRPAK